MSINKNVARVLMQHKEEYALSFDDLSRKLGIARSSTVNYCNGAVNLRADTLELLAERCGVAITELVSECPGGPRFRGGSRLFFTIKMQLLCVKRNCI